MLTLKEIQRRLEMMNLSQVAKGSGIHYNAIYRLSRGATDAKYSTVKAVSDYLESFEKEMRGDQ